MEDGEQRYDFFFKFNWKKKKNRTEANSEDIIEENSDDLKTYHLEI